MKALTRPAAAGVRTEPQADPGEAEDTPLILVVDDDVNIQAVLRYRLEAAGHSVVTAADGAEALELISSDAPDAVILDLMMPLVDGIEVLEQMARDASLHAIPVLVLTARVDKIDAARSFGTAVVQKPFSPRDVTERIEDMLDQGPPVSDS